LEELLDEEEEEDEVPKKKSSKKASRSSKRKASEFDSPSNRRTTRSTKKSFDDEDDFAPERRRSLRNVTKRANSKPPKVPTLIRKGRLSEPFLTCSNILEELMDSEDAAPFNTPVDEDVEDYYKIVKNPIDLSTVWVISCETSCITQF
jgi:hypothetical protein